MMEREQCKWRLDDDFIWATECGNLFEINNGGGPADNGFRFCPYCGKRLVEKCEAA